MTQLAFLDIAPPQMWTRIDIEDSNAELVVPHRIHRVADAPDRRAALLAEPPRAVVVPEQEPSPRAYEALGARVLATVVAIRELARNTIFRNESRTLSSLLIISATAISFEVFVRRYGALPREPLTSEIDIDATAGRRGRERPPGYCYECAGWKWVRSVLPGHGRNAKAIYEAPRLEGG